MINSCLIDVNKTQTFNIHRPHRNWILVKQNLVFFIRLKNGIPDLFLISNFLYN